MVILDEHPVLLVIDVVYFKNELTIIEDVYRRAVMGSVERRTPPPRRKSPNDSTALIALRPGTGEELMEYTKHVPHPTGRRFRRKAGDNST